MLVWPEVKVSLTHLSTFFSLCIFSGLTRLMGVSFVAEAIGVEGGRAGQWSTAGGNRNKGGVQIQNQLVQLLYGLINVCG